MDDKLAQFMPFNAINEFMRDEYRLQVIRVTFDALPSLPDEFRRPIDHLTRKVVQVPGFRNSSKAPLAIRVKPTAEAFEKSPQLVAAILAAWAATHADLSQRVYDLLVSRNWEVLPPSADRTKLPGFITKWPKGENFEVLSAAYIAKYPDQPVSSDDVSLMVVWISTRLPYIKEDNNNRPGAKES
jgi:hypothetical protein